MSGRPLSRKPVMRESYTVYAMNAPADYMELLGEVPEGVSFVEAPSEPVDLIHVFVGDRAELEAKLAELKPLMKPKFDFEGKYDLWSFKDVEIAGRKRKEVYFAGLIVQSKWKSKSCFRIKELDEELEGQIDEVLEKGYRLYQQRGWI